MCVCVCIYKGHLYLLVIIYTSTFVYMYMYYLSNVSYTSKTECMYLFQCLITGMDASLWFPISFPCVFPLYYYMYSIDMYIVFLSVKVRMWIHTSLIRTTSYFVMNWIVLFLLCSNIRNLLDLIFSILVVINFLQIVLS